MSRNIGDTAIYPGGIDISCAWSLLKTELRVWTVGVRDGPTTLISAPLIKLCLRNTCFGRATRARVYFQGPGVFNHDEGCRDWRRAVLIAND